MSMDTAREALRSEAASLRAQLQAVEKALADLGGGTYAGKLRSIPGGAGPRKSTISAAGRAAIGAAARRRWAKVRAAKKARSAAASKAAKARNAKPRKAVKKVAQKAASKG